MAAIQRYLVVDLSSFHSRCKFMNNKFLQEKGVMIYLPCIFILYSLVSLSFWMPARTQVVFGDGNGERLSM